MPGPSQQSCSACRQAKRKCSGEQPTCSRCMQKLLHCSYPNKDPEILKHGDSPASNSTIRPGQSQLRCQAYFLDAELLSQFPSLPKTPPVYKLPHILQDEFEEYLPLLSDTEYLDTYFQSIHGFFPIVSKTRLAQDIAPAKGDIVFGDLYILLMTMHLFCQPIETVNFPTTALYLHLKNCLNILEAHGFMSLRAFQAQLLLGLFEFAHAIYPAAYITVGSCARVGYVLQLNDLGSKFPPRLVQIPPSWVSLEEHRRSWHGLLVLDRFCSIGTRSPMACQDLKPHDLLPANDIHWDKGDPLIIQALAASSDVSNSASPFSRTCQAAHLLSKVLHQIRNNDVSPVELFKNAIQLHDILHAFQTALWQEILNSRGMNAIAESHIPLLTPMAIALSADQLLCFEYSCADLEHPETVGIQEQIEMQRIAISGLEDLFGKVRDLANLVIEGCSLGTSSSVGPFVCDCLYQAARVTTLYTQETNDSNLKEGVEDALSALNMLGARWMVANKYFGILNMKS